MSGRKFMTAGDGEPVTPKLAVSLGPGGIGDGLRQWLDARTPRRVPFIFIAGDLLDVRRLRTDFMIPSKPFCMKDLIQAIGGLHLGGIFPRFEITVNNNMGCLPYENHSSNIKMSGSCKSVKLPAPGFARV